ncbi:MAG: hypothetical protein B6U94_06580 [Thermofilum sp. ex4484_79]|nr:MAG: hypothetical protein B6U94_06580 [Thermofilum sp. ex4484_79]
MEDLAYQESKLIVLLFRKHKLIYSFSMFTGDGTMLSTLHENFIAVALSFVCAVLNSFGALVLKKCTHFGAFESNFIRLSVTTLIFILLSIPYATKDEINRILPVLIWLALAVIIGLAIGDTFYIKSLQYIGVTRTAAISSVYPLFVGIWGYFAGEKITIFRTLGIFLIVASIWLSTNFSFNRCPETGVILSLGAAVSWAIGIVLIRTYIGGLNVIVANAMRYPFAIPFMLLLLMVNKDKFSNLRKMPREDYIMLTFSGVLTVVSNILFVYSLQIAEASLVSPIVATQPILTSLLAYAILKENINCRVWLSVFLLMVGTILLL